MVEQPPYMGVVWEGSRLVWAQQLRANTCCWQCGVLALEGRFFSYLTIFNTTCIVLMHEGAGRTCTTPQRPHIERNGPSIQLRAPVYERTAHCRYRCAMSMEYIALCRMVSREHPRPAIHNAITQPPEKNY